MTSPTSTAETTMYPFRIPACIKPPGKNAKIDKKTARERETTLMRSHNNELFVGINKAILGTTNYNKFVRLLYNKIY